MSPSPARDRPGCGSIPNPLSAPLLCAQQCWRHFTKSKKRPGRGSAGRSGHLRSLSAWRHDGRSLTGTFGHDKVCGSLSELPVSIPLKNLFEVADRLLVIGTHHVLDGVEVSGPPPLVPLKLSGNRRLVLQRLADHVNFSSNKEESRRGSWVSRRTLAAGSMSPKTVDRVIVSLVRLGLIRSEPRFCASGKNAESQFSNLYTFNPMALSAAKGPDKFRAAIVIPADGLTWPPVRELSVISRFDGPAIKLSDGR